MGANPTRTSNFGIDVGFESQVADAGRPVLVSREVWFVQTCPIETPLAIVSRNYFKEITMKNTYFENVVNKERFICPNLDDVRMIDGIEYIRVLREATRRECLVRKDSLRKIPKSKIPF